MAQLLRSALLSAVALAAGLSVAPVAHARAGIPELENSVRQYLQEEAAATHWKLRTVNLEEQSRIAKDGRMEVVYEVKVEHTLNFATPEEVPLLKGERAYLFSQGNTLDAVRRAAADQELAYWHNQFYDAIHTPQEASEQLKVTVELSDAGTLRPESVRIFMAGPTGEFRPVEEFLSNLTTEEEIVEQGKKAMENVLNDARTTPSATNALYNRTNAVSYINKYTSATTKACSGGSAYQDPSKYNSAYSYYACNDCANFVSQALKAGGIPTTSTWKGGTSAWINVDSLKSYMVGTKAYWKSISCSAAKNGDVILLGTSSDYYHTMMTVGNNGSSTLTYSAHTNDRLKSTISYTYSNLTCWQVVY